MDLFNKKKVASLKKEISILIEENKKLKDELENIKLTKDEVKYLDLNNELLNLDETINFKKNSIKEYESTIAEVKSKIENANEEYESICISIKKDSQKLSKIKPLYLSIKNILSYYPKLDIFNEEFENLLLSTDEEDLLNELAPTITLKLHSMDVKSLRKEMTINNKAIDDVLSRYEERYTTKSNLAIYRLMVIALRSELQNVLYNLKYDKLDKSIESIKTITNKYLSISNDGNKQIFKTLTKFISEIEYLFIQATKIEYEYYLKKQQEKEEQAALREQMKQEAEERKLLAQQQKQVEKEEEKYKNEILKVQEQIKSSEDNNKLIELEAKILELQNQLNKVSEKKEEIISRQNGKAGYVYVISNLGSFGENVFKIGMTRRLEPMDRISELSNASVPFSFDVHSFIFSDDAVSLEQKLHSILNNERVNKINLRKEFFRTNIDKLKELVEEINPSAEFNTTMLAEQYRESISLEG